ncbi:hypothetical protein QR680_011385 [Steinernema hermaphroditum]|uniref:FERM domain-containing protein n=1 Tax=Steinernema hermaphroditum TaxID=289476 RepID=A0AA39ITJ4_9BILA|nr:hypothetical protein QR680_011385 [Steinernema hermaphroditum]
MDTKNNLIAEEGARVSSPMSWRNTGICSSQRDKSHHTVCVLKAGATKDNNQTDMATSQAAVAPNGNATSNGGPSTTSKHHHSIFSRLMARGDLRITVQLLDDSDTVTHEFKRSSTGQEVLDYVCQQIDIVEKDYFGLRYQDSNKHRVSFMNSDNNGYWIDLTKPISKQIKSDSVVLRLRFRFYPANPILVKEEITRYQLFVQLQRDLLHGRLYCPQNEAAVLAALILQSELGDHDETEHKPGYVSEYKLLLKQSARVEEAIAEAHKTFAGLSPAQAESEFLTRAARYDTYGFDPYAVKDAKQVNTIYIGVNHDGILIYQTNHKLHHIKWANVEKVDYVNKQLRIYPSAVYYQEYLVNKSGVASPNSTLNTSFDSNVFDDVGGKAGKKPMLKFVCPSVLFAKHLWRHILSQQAFFTEDEARTVKPKFSKPRIPLLSRGSTFRLPTRKVLAEIETEPAPRKDPPSHFTRYHLSKQIPRDALDQPWLTGNKYATMPAMRNLKSSTIIEENLVQRKASLTQDKPLLEDHQNKPCSSQVEEKQNGDLVSSVEKTMPLGNAPSGASYRPSILPEDHKENVTVFSIHLVRSEDAGRSSLIREKGRLTEKPRPVSYNFEKVSANISATPMETSINSTLQLDASFDADEGASAATNTSTESTLHSPQRTSTPLFESNVSEQRVEKSMVRKAANVMLSMMLLMLLLVALLITLFESQNEASWTEQFPALEAARHEVYEPCRHYVLNAYRRYFSK